MKTHQTSRPRLTSFLGVVAALSLTALAGGGAQAAESADDAAYQGAEAPTSDTATVTIPDAALLWCLNHELDVPRPGNTPFTIAEMADVSNVICIEQDVEDLTGVEYAINATTVNLSGNNVSDLTPLQNLSKVKYLTLDRNAITDISPLAGLIDNLHDMNIHEQHVSQAPVAAATPVPNPVISIDGQPVSLYLGSTNICDPDSDCLNVTYPEPGDAVQVSWDTYIIYGGSHPTPFSGFFTRQVKQQFSVSFTPGEGDGAPFVEQILAGDNLVLPDPGSNFSYPGRVFTGWLNQETDEVVAAGETVPVTADATYIAQWEETNTPVTERQASFDLNGGQGDFPTLTVTDPDSFRLPSSMPTRAGHKFIGWLPATLGRTQATETVQPSGLLQPGAQYPLSADTLFVAQWEASAGPDSPSGNSDGGAGKPTTAQPENLTRTGANGVQLALGAGLLLTLGACAIELRRTRM